MCRIEQRYVARDDEHVSLEIGGQGIQRRFDGPAGARHVVLIGDERLGVEVEDGGGDGVALVPHDGDDVGGLERAGGGEHVADEGHAGERVQHLRQARLHAGALAGGEHDDGETGIGHPPILSHRAARRDRSARTAASSAASSASDMPGWRTRVKTASLASPAASMRSRLCTIAPSGIVTS